MDGNNGNEKVVCCFCGKSLEIEKAVLIQVFPVMNDNESQQLFCHRICLDELLHKSIPRHPDLLIDEGLNSNENEKGNTN